MTSYAKFPKRNSIFDRSLFFNENTINVFVFILKLKKEERKKPVSMFFVQNIFTIVSLLGDNSLSRLGLT